jgi:hypothetical protein
MLYLQNNENIEPKEIKASIKTLLNREYLTTSEAAKVLHLMPHKLMYMRTRHILSGPPFIFLPHQLRPDHRQQVWYPTRELKWWMWSTGKTPREAQALVQKRLGIKLTLSELQNALFSVTLIKKVRYPLRQLETWLGANYASRVV